MQNNIETQICDYKNALKESAMRFTQNHDDADDLVQDTILKGIRYSALFIEGTNLRAWLHTIMKNTFINNYRVTTRKNKLIQTTDELNSFQLMIGADKNLSEGSFIKEDILRALKMLTPQYYVPFIRYFEGYKYKEIAVELKLPIGTVKTRIRLARQLLRNKLTMYENTK